MAQVVTSFPFDQLFPELQEEVVERADELAAAALALTSCANHARFSRYRIGSQALLRRVPRTYAALCEWERALDVVYTGNALLLGDCADDTGEAACFLEQLANHRPHMFPARMEWRDQRMRAMAAVCSPSFARAYVAICARLIGGTEVKASYFSDFSAMANELGNVGASDAIEAACEDAQRIKPFFPTAVSHASEMAGSLAECTYAAALSDAEFDCGLVDVRAALRPLGHALRLLANAIYHQRRDRIERLRASCPALTQQVGERVGPPWRDDVYNLVAVVVDEARAVLFDEFVRGVLVPLRAPTAVWLKYSLCPFAIDYAFRVGMFCAENVICLGHAVDYATRAYLLAYYARTISVEPLGTGQLVTCLTETSGAVFARALSKDFALRSLASDDLMIWLSAMDTPVARLAEILAQDRLLLHRVLTSDATHLGLAPSSFDSWQFCNDLAWIEFMDDDIYDDTVYRAEPGRQRMWAKLPIVYHTTRWLFANDDARAGRTDRVKWAYAVMDTIINIDAHNMMRDREAAVREARKMPPARTVPLLLIQSLFRFLVRQLQRLDPTNVDARLRQYYTQCRSSPDRIALFFSGD